MEKKLVYNLLWFFPLKNGYADHAFYHMSESH